MKGIWIHTRLLAGNIAQFILTFGLLVFGSFFIDDIVNMVYRALDTMRSPGVSIVLVVIFLVYIAKVFIFHMSYLQSE